MSGLLYEEESFGLFLLVTVVMGGGAAWLSGRAIAATWRPYVQMIGYMALLAAAVRFMHFALFGAELLGLGSYLVDFIWLLAVGSLSYRLRLAAQMVAQYPWLYERNGPLAWKAKTTG